MSEDPALAAGALGYVTKARAATELVPAVEAALGGHRPRLGLGEATDLSTSE